MKHAEESNGDDVRSEEGFLTRWSRRKQAAEQSEQPSAEASESDDEVDRSADPADVPPPDANTEAAEAEVEPPGDDDMPPLESIDAGGSVAEFLSPNVSEGLRRSALRRLWRQPEFSAEDLLDDYARDYSKREPLGDIVTAEMRYRAEQLRKRMQRKLEEGLAEADKAASPDHSDAERVAAADNPAAPEATISDSDVESDKQALAGDPDSCSDSRPDQTDPDDPPGSDRSPV